MHMHKGALALGVTAALSTMAFVRSSDADATPGAKPRNVAGPSHGEPHFKYPLHSRPTGGSILYDQGGPAVSGAPSQNFESSLDQYDAQGADDFVVTDAAGWTVSAFNFQISPSTSPPGDPATATYDIEVFPDAVGVPGVSPVCSYPSAAGAVDPGITSLSVSLPTPCALAQGTYWIKMVVNLDSFVGGRILWSDNSSGSGANAEWQNPGGGFGTTCSTWSDLIDCDPFRPPTGPVGSQTAFLFQVVGSVGASSGCAAGDLCLVSTVGTDTTAGACATTDTIDATVGDQLNFCYTITNNTSIELDYHTLQNNVDGTLLSLLNQPVPANGTFQFNHIATVGTTNIYNSTWTGQDIPPGYLAEVTTGTGGCPDRIFTDGFDGSTPPCGTSGFIDITSTGTPLNNEDDQAIAVTMPFSFNFYGTTANQLCVDNNGFVLFNTALCPPFGLYANVSLPGTSLSAPAIMPLWDDFDSESGNIYTDTRGSTPNRQFIVEWFDRVHYDGGSNTDGATFELILNEDGTIQFEYSDVAYSALGNLTGDPDDCANGICATIGLQNTQTLFNQFSAFEASVTDNSGIKWTATTPQVFTSTGTTTVNVGAPVIVVNPSPIVGAVPAGGSSTIPFAIENHGNRDLNWNLTEAGPANLHFPPPGSRFAMPLGDPAEVSNRPVPLALRHPNGHKPGQHSFHIPFGPGTVPTFAADIYSNNFETFDALAPSTTTIVAPTDGTPWTGGAFIDGDFSKLYVISGSFGANPDTFASVDTTTGVVTTIGFADSGGTGWDGMAYDTSTGTLYAVAGCGSSSTLYTIDQNTGASTVVGTLANETCSIAIAFDPDGNLYSLDVINDALYAVDKTNANDSAIGSIGFNANYAQDMAFDESTGILYLAGFDGDNFTDSTYTVDLQTGTATLIGPIGASTGEVDAMDIETVGGPCAQPQDLPWLSLDPPGGTTAPSGSSPVNATIDATGANDGDILSGTVCASSNDPVSHTLATPITVTVTAGAVIPPTLTKDFNPATVVSGTPSTLTITLGNGNAAPATLTAALIDAFPTGLLVAPSPNASTTCGGAVIAVAGSDSVTLDATGSSIPASGSCTVTVDVSAAAPNGYANSIAIGALQTLMGSNAASADATLTVDPPPPPPTVDEQFNPATVPTNTPSTLTITLANTNASPATLTAPFTDAFPPGLVVAAMPNATTTCGGQVIAVANDIAVTLDDVNSVIPASGSCTVQIDVEAANPGTFDNTIAAGTLQTDAGQNTVAAVATLNVTAPPPLPPTIAKDFNPLTVAAGIPSTLTITLANGNATVTTLTAPLIDAFPAGLVIAATPNASTTCGGTVTAVAAADSVTLDDIGSTIPAAGSCTITVDVESATPASYPNDIPAGALQTSDGSNTAPADATLDVTP
jgi:hypothetical protein